MPKDPDERSYMSAEERLSRCEERLDMLEDAIAVNAKIWHEWVEQAKKAPTKRKGKK